MNCAVCQRPLFEGATACIVCGAPVAPPASAAPPAPPLRPAIPTTDAYAPTYFVPAFVPTQPTRPSPAAPPVMPRPPEATVAFGPSPYTPPPALPSPYSMPMPMHAPPPYPAWSAPQQNAPNSLATISFVCGMLGLVPLWIGFALCIIAIVCGGFGIQAAGRLPGQRGRGLAIAGLVLGLVFLVPAGCGL